MHSSYLVQMFDSAINMLGPDSEMLTEIMLSLGKKHVRNGVTPDMFPLKGEALIGTLDSCLKGGLSDRAREAWREQVYSTLTDDMVSAMLENQ